MPAKVKVKILSGRNLPVMDRGSDTTDAYVEIKFGNITHKTDVCRKSLNPQWNSDWYRFDVDDAELQDEPLQIRLMDHDTYSANDAIGKVNISLNPLLMPSAETSGAPSHTGKGAVMSGWIPVFDTMHGIRGEVNVMVKVDLFSDLNKFRQSSCGVQFFHSSNIPHGYAAQIIHGFVEELVVNDDPEYQWIDKIRTPRASNEARQVVFLKLSGQVQRKIGLKAIDLGANAVIGYTQCFDLEGDVGVVARGIGTAVTLIKVPDSAQQSLIDNTVLEERTLKYLEFLSTTNKPDSSSIFDSQHHDTPSIVQDILGIDTSLFEVDYVRNKSTEDLNSDRRGGGIGAGGGVGGDETDDGGTSSKNSRKFIRRLSDLKDKMFSIPSKITDVLKENNPVKSRRSKDRESDDAGGFRMGALLIRSIMSTKIAESPTKETTASHSSLRKNLEKSSSSSSDSESSSKSIDDKNMTDESDKRTNDILVIDAENLCTIMQQLIREGKIKPDGEWIAPDEPACPIRPLVDAVLCSSSSVSSSSSSVDENSNDTQRDLSGPANDEDGYDTIWIKPDITITDSEVDDKTQIIFSQSIFESLKNAHAKLKHSASIDSSQTDSRRDSMQGGKVKLTHKKSFTKKRSKRSKVSRSVERKSQSPGPSKHVKEEPPSPKPVTSTPFIPNRFRKLSSNLSLPYNLSNLAKKTESFYTNTNQNANQLHAQTSRNVNRNELSASPANTRASAGPIGIPNANQQQQHHARTESMSGPRMSQSPAKNTLSTLCASVIQKETTKSDTGIFRRSSDSDLSVTPKGNSLTSDSRLTGMMMRTNIAHIKQPLNQENLDMLEYPFLTISKYPSDFILHLGATVAARSVKLLERVPNPDEPETRDSWWTELRMEIRSHARALGCNVVIGYSEVTTISEEVCVLSATGTAAVINFQYAGDHSVTSLMTNSLDRQEFESEIRDGVKEIRVGNNKNDSDIDLQMTNGGSVGGPALVGTAITNTKEPPPNIPLPIKQKGGKCTICHIPYTQSSVPYQVSMKKCAICKRGKVPDVILATVEIPEEIQVTGRGCLLQAQVCRPKRDLRSEQNAKEISDGLPFLEYELHRLLINKLKVKGMNAIFGLKATVAIGERMIALMATGTAVYVTSLPPAIVPKIVAGNLWSDMDKLGDLQKALNDTFDRNRDIYQLKYNTIFAEAETNGKCILSDTDESDDELTEMDLTHGNKDTCILEVDDIEDVEIIASLMERCPPEGFHVVNTQTVPGLLELEAVRNLQMFTQVWRAKFPISQCNINFAKHFQRILQSIYYKLRQMTPCAICDLKYRLDFPETDEIQLLITGMALGLGEPRILKPKRKRNPSVSKDEELIFDFDEDLTNELKAAQASNFTSASSSAYPTHTQSLRLKNRSPNHNRFGKYSRHTPVKERYGVDITPLSYIPGGIIDKYLGNLNFFFIRESTSVRENGGISGFVHSFITEVLAIVRAHVTALNGNAMVAFYMTELILVDNPHKNQGQCIISVGGDVVQISYRNDD